MKQSHSIGRRHGIHFHSMLEQLDSAIARDIVERLRLLKALHLPWLPPDQVTLAMVRGLGAIISEQVDSERSQSASRRATTLLHRQIADPLGLSPSVWVTNCWLGLHHECCCARHAAALVPNVINRRRRLATLHIPSLSFEQSVMCVGRLAGVQSSEVASVLSISESSCRRQVAMLASTIESSFGASEGHWQCSRWAIMHLDCCVMQFRLQNEEIGNLISND